MFDDPAGLFSPDQLRNALRSHSDWSPMEAWEAVCDALETVPEADRERLTVWLYQYAAGQPVDDASFRELSNIWARTSNRGLIAELLWPDHDADAPPVVEWPDVAAAARIIIAECLDGRGPTDTEGREIVYDSSGWRMFKLATPLAVLRQYPQSGAINALWDAVLRCSWVVEQENATVGLFTYDVTDPELYEIEHFDPNWIEILNDRPSLFALPPWVRESIWERCLMYAKGDLPAGTSETIAGRARDTVRTYRLVAENENDFDTLREIADAMDKARPPQASE